MGSWVQEFLIEDVRALLFGAALLLGILVFVFLSFGLRSKRREKRKAELDKQITSQSFDEDDVKNLMSEEIGDEILVTSVPEAGLEEFTIAAPIPPEKLSPDNLRAEANLLEDIRRLETQGDSVDLAILYSERATAALDANDTPMAQEYFLKGLSMASLVNAQEQVAFARMKLGDICHESSDFTTACEHWQLARELYAECGEMERVAEVEERMEKNQCPTDWVLNGF